MSIEVVRNRLRSACMEETPKVIFLTGGWGEGKTHQWKQALKEAQAQGNPPKYAYVSLFGVNSLADARRRLAEEFVAAIRVPGEEGTLGAKVSELTSTAKYMQAFKFLPLIPFIGKADVLLNELSFSVVRNAVICIDDIERKGAGLTVADVFGLASFLKEERGCRVVLVANDKRFADGDATAAQLFLEKVVDEKVNFAPTTLEACDIAFGPSPPQLSLLLREHLQSIEVANIRVISRLNRLVKAMGEALEGLDERVLTIGVLALTVFGLGHFLPDGRFPPINFVLARQDGGWLRYASRKSQDGPLTDAQKNEEKWEELLNRLGGPGADPFETALADAVQNGYLAPKLRQLAEDLAARLDIRALSEAYHEAWTDFWHSLRGTGDELLDSLAETTRRALPAIGPGDLRQGYNVFVAAGREAQADELLMAFIEAHKSEPRMFDRRNSAFPENFSGHYGDVLDEAAAKYIVGPSTEEALDLLDVNAYDPENAIIVARASSEVLEKLVKASTGRKFRSRVRVLLALGSMAPGDPKAAATSAQFAATLKAWANADPITAIRLRQYLPQEP